MTDTPKDHDTDPGQAGTDDARAKALAEALAEQAAAEQATPAEPTPSADQEAITGQQAENATATKTGETSRSDTAARTADDAVFKPLADESGQASPRDLDMIMEIPVTLSVELGSTRLSIRELLDLAQGSIVELDGLAGEPMDILINGYLVAQGEVVVVEDKYGIRITDIVDRAERIGKLNR